MTYKKWVSFWAVFGLGVVLSGCSTIDAQRPSWAQDSIDVTGSYFGDALSEPEFEGYGLNSSYKVKDGDLKLYLDPYERHLQLKKKYTQRRQIYYVRSGPHQYNPVACVLKIVTVFPLLTATSDFGKRKLKKQCNKTYDWSMRTKDLPPVEDGVGKAEIITRHYQDSDGSLSAKAKGGEWTLLINRLSGFNNTNRQGPLVWHVNKLVQFAFLDMEDVIELTVVQHRDGKTITNTMTLNEDESEAVIFRSKYDGAFRLKYTCRKCNANLTDNPYTDQEVLIWTTPVYYYKGDDRLGYIASCIEKRFDHLRNGNVAVERAATPSRVYKDHQYLYDNNAYTMVRRTRTPREPQLDDIRSCIDEKRFLDMEVTDQFR